MNFPPISLILFVFILFVAADCHSQKFEILENGASIEDGKVAPGDSLNGALNDFLLQMWDDGYLGASIDSISGDSILKRAYLHRGQAYKWGSLVLSESPDVFQDIGDLGYRYKPGKKGLGLNSFQSFKARAVTYLENHGFPFASAKYQDLRFEGDTLHANLFIQKGPLVQIDSLLLRTKAKVNPLFLQNYLEIRKGNPYNESIIRRIPTRIDEIPFLSIERPTEVLFAENKANVYLYLKEQKASFANGVIGLQPDAETGEITITGQLELKLLNALKRGELIHLNWRRLQNETQDLQLSLNYPYIFGTNIGVGGNLKIYRRDSTFSSVNSRFELAYLLKGGNTIGAFVAADQTNRLANFNSAIGNFGNVRTSNYGLRLDYKDLDYRFNPRSGFSVLLSGMVGVKRFSDSLLVDDILRVPGNSLQYSIDGDLQYFQPITSRMTLQFKLVGASTINDIILENEMHRIGGLARLRGFDEETIFATSFAIGTLEWRYLLGKNSRYFVFVDQGYYVREGINRFEEDDPLGFGTGISFETTAGIFSLSYALGKSFDNPIVLRSAKIHFGFTSLF